MSKVLVIAEHDGTNLNGSTARAVSCASDLGLDGIDIVCLLYTSPSPRDRG